MPSTVLTKDTRIIKPLLVGAAFLCALAAWLHGMVISPATPVTAVHRIAVVLPTIALLGLVALEESKAQKAAKALRQTASRSEKIPRWPVFLCNAVQSLCFVASIVLLVFLNGAFPFGVSADEIMANPQMFSAPAPYWHSPIGSVLLLVEYLLAAAALTISYLKARGFAAARAR